MEFLWPKHRCPSWPNISSDKFSKERRLFFRLRACRVKSHLCEPALNISASVSFFYRCESAFLAWVFNTRQQHESSATTCHSSQNGEFENYWLKLVCITTHVLVRSLSVLVSMHLIERPRKWLKKGRGQRLVVCFRELLVKRKFTTVY